MIEKKWPGETFVILGSGPSLVQEDVDYCRGKARMICVNTTYQLCPWADVLFAADWGWWRWHHASTTDFPLRYRLQESAKRKWYPEGVQTIAYRQGTQFETDPRYLGTPSKGLSCSGYLAINLAVHLGAVRILLLGYDCCRDDRGRAHFHGNHPDRSEPPLSAFAKGFACLIAPLKRLGIAVINCSRRTVLNAFPRMSLEAALC